MKEKLFAFLDEQDTLFVNLPDGALMQSLQDSVDIFNEDNKTNFDPYETVMEWIKRETKQINTR